MSNNNFNRNENNNEIIIPLPAEGEFTDVNLYLSSAEEGSTIRFLKGKYMIKETITFEKSMNFLGVGIGKTVLIGKNLHLLIQSIGENTIELEGITFRNKKSKKPITIGTISSKLLKIKDCGFSGGRHSDEMEEGIGLRVEGSTKVEINFCRFDRNDESGLLLTENVSGTVSNCRFSLNDCGATTTNSAVIAFNKCESYKNNVGIAYADYSSGEVSDCSFTENRCGLMAKGESKPSIHNNKIRNNKAAIGLAEDCDVLIEENEINENEYGIMTRQYSKASILKNQIYKNMVGIKCSEETRTMISDNQLFDQSMIGILVTDKAFSKIEDNKIFENGRCGIQSDDQVEIEFINNNVTGNLLFGLLVTGESHIKVENNTLSNNGIKNIRAQETANVEAQNNIEVESKSKPVIFEHNQNDFFVTAPSAGEIVSFGDLIAQAEPGQIINLEKGKYMLSEPIEIDKPLQLVADKPGLVSILGSELPFLINYAGDGKLIIKGINFKCMGIDKTNGIIFDVGELEMDQCNVDGAKALEKKSQDGVGLLILYAKSAAITNSVFYGNKYGIVSVETSVAIKENKCYQNEYGVSLFESSSGIIEMNECYENIFGIYIGDKSSCIIKENDCYDNKEAGVACFHESKATILANKIHDNKAGIYVDNNANPSIESNLCSGNLNGILINDNASANVTNNKCYDNGYSGILLYGNTNSTIENNEFYDNINGVKIEDKANARIQGNKIYRNFGEGILNNSENECEILDNELFENGESSEGIFVLPRGVTPGNLVAKMLGSENLSDDPNVAVIPLGHLMKGTNNSDNGEDEDGQEEQ